MTSIVNAYLPSEHIKQASLRRLPGIAPLDMVNWIQVSDVYAEQMALRRRLIVERDVVVEGDVNLGCELLDMVLAQLSLRSGFEVSDETVRCPDGVVVKIDRAAPLMCLAQIVQEDFCILVPQEGAYIFRSAVLCFPASWTLSEKVGRPLLGIHTPVDSYTDDVAKRVQRLFDAIRPNAPLWRVNALFYDGFDLHHPLTEAAPRRQTSDVPPYLRSERQSLVRLPKSGAVVFSIHTYLLCRESLPADFINSLSKD